MLVRVKNTFVEVVEQTSVIRRTVSCPAQLMTLTTIDNPQGDATIFDDHTDGSIPQCNAVIDNPQGDATISDDGHLPRAPGLEPSAIHTDGSMPQYHAMVLDDGHLPHAHCSEPFVIHTDGSMPHYRCRWTHGMCTAERSPLADIMSVICQGDPLTSHRASSSTTRWADIVDDGDEDEHEDDFVWADIVDDGDEDEHEDDFVWTETEPDEEPEGDEP